MYTWACISPVEDRSVGQTASTVWRWADWLYLEPATTKTEENATRRRLDRPAIACAGSTRPSGRWRASAVRRCVGAAAPAEVDRRRFTWASTIRSKFASSTATRRRNLSSSSSDSKVCARQILLVEIGSEMPSVALFKNALRWQKRKSYWQNAERLCMLQPYGEKPTVTNCAL